jgi:hypothetical protein
MGTVVAFTVGLVIWIVLWANGAKAFDAFMIPVFLLLVGGTMRMVLPYVRERLLP